MNITELVREAGIYDGREGLMWCSKEQLERFAALVTAEKDKEIAELYEMSVKQAKTIKEYQDAEPVKQEPVMDYEYICALREGEQHQAEDSYFFVRPENDTPTSRKMFCQGFERGFHKGLKYAAPVSAKREWVDLTDDEIDLIEQQVYCRTTQKGRPLGVYAVELVRAVIAAFKEKNK